MEPFVNKFQIMEDIATLSRKPSGVQLKLRRIKWNNRTPSYDLRWWSKDDEPLKGVSFNSNHCCALHM